MNAAEVLSKARDVLAERGWHQGASEGSDGSVCLDGAMCFATSGNPHQVAAALAYTDALQAVRQVIGCTWHDHWNDDPSRTYEDVVLALKQAEELAVERGL